MASLKSSVLGITSQICDGEFDLGSYCTQRTMINAVNLLFLFLFCLFTLIASIRKHYSSSSPSRRDRFSLVVSVCCALTGIAYFGAGLWILIANNDDLSNCFESWLDYLVRGLVWISFTISLLVQRSRWIKILNSVWWVSSFSLVSAVNIEILTRTHSIRIFDVLTWPVSFLLLLCAVRNLSHFVHDQSQENSISEPLLAKKSAEKSQKTQLGNAGFLSKLTFSWINPLLTLGYSKTLAPEDIPYLVSEDEADLAYQKFAQAWESLSRDKSSSSTRNLVMRAIAKVYLKENIWIAFCAFLRTIAVVVSPLILYAFVNYSNAEEENFSQGLIIVGCLIITKVVESFTQRHWFFDSRRSGMRMRSALMVAVYQKQLKLSSVGRRRHSAGEIVNYIAVDAYRMGEFPWWFHSTWSFALQLLLAIGVLFRVVGVGALPGLIPLFICGLLNVPFAKALQKCQSQFMIAQDERLRATSEILNSMKIIKLQSWEEKFKNSVNSLREREFKWLSEGQFRKAYGTLLYWMSPTIISSVVFLGCILFKSVPLNASTIFTVLASLRSMGEPVRMIPEALSVMIQVKVSFDRLNDFLLDDELKDDEIRKLPSPNSDESLRIQTGIFSWYPESAIQTLKEVNLEAKCEQKIAVCGPVGAGKSSLLFAILGEMPKISGAVDVFGTIAYVSQTSWIQSGTVRDNILYGKPMDKNKYEKTIKACALDKDINSFDHGDLTEIGQRGINMSGGQKQRIQLARAVYSDADIYLLDDPFSAVDAHTAAILFHDCVMDALAKKTVILVTHQVEFLSEVDKILVMESGQVTQSGIIDLYGTKIFWMNLSSSRGIQKQISTSSKARKLIALSFLRISLAYMEFKRIYEGTYLTRNQKQPSYYASLVDWMGARIVAAILWPLHVLGTKLVYSKIHSAIGISKAGISAGGSLPAHIDKFFEAIGVKLQNGYGLTESSPAVTARRPNCNVLGSVGHPLRHTEFKVVDSETGEVLPPGSSGIVNVRGPQVMKGYYKNPDATEQVLDKDGWLSTGDIGWIAPHHSIGRSRRCGGVVVLEGRAKDTIVLSTGENVEPVELEEAAMRSSLIQQIVVIGQDQRRLGAIIVPNKEEALLAATKTLSVDANTSDLSQDKLTGLLYEELRKWTSGCSFQIGPILIVDEPFTIDSGLMTPTMKIRRDKVVAQFKEQIDELYKKNS